MARVAVAMSGGVDSSVAAALLVQAGHEVVGFTLNLWPAWLPEEGNPHACCGVGAVEDARATAHHLGIRHYVLNFREAFEEAVVRPFAEEYARGRTPNPCVACNRHVKFSLLLDRARSLRMDFLATGHYVRTRRDGAVVRLLRAVDVRKDQSYVLCGLTQRELTHILFPLGELRKDEVRQLARELKLPVADKPESQEICFAPSGRYTEVVARLAPHGLRPGPIYDLQGKRVGTHQGLARYTLGQRRGLGVAAGRPLYVVAMDPDRNALFVGSEEDARAVELVVDDVTWTVRPPEVPRFRAQVQIRHGAPAADAWLEVGPRVRVRFDVPQWLTSPGQVACFYVGEEVLGGGTVAEVVTVAADRLVEPAAV
ncbi:MAG: tRNA 2-thiouridine(34) synthase MnmA [Armatimonadetes bacterium]|nr:tRNA 2-thiouridine(34) synthase MnmA [Armatimonadota bacterium]